MKGLAIISLLLWAVAASPLETRDGTPTSYPTNGQGNVNPDAQLKLTFPSPPTIGPNGTIKVYDASNNILIDSLDMSIPFSPSPYGNGSTKANYSDTTTYQTNIIGGMDFYFYPIIVNGNVATIYIHNNQLTYGKTYHIVIDPSVLKVSGGWSGFTTSNPWTFSTKACGPSPDATEVVVAADGSADFNTVCDFPDNSSCFITL